MSPVPMPKLVFWYEFASTYSYLAAMRIEDEAKKAGVEVVWQPFLLGPLFKAQGWATSPFNIYPAKGRYMVRDIERFAVARGIPFRMPPTFPAQSLKAARLALVAADEGWQLPFSKAVFQAAFGNGEDIGADAVLARIVNNVGRDFVACSERCATPEIKDRLRRISEQAAALGLFGAPTFACADGELFWGDDRMEQALAWARRVASAGRK